MNDIQIRPERANHPLVVERLDQLDAYLASLYAPEHNHNLDMSALMAPDVHLLFAWPGEQVVACGAARCERAGYRLRAAFGAHPDNGLSLFYGKSMA
jgi:hypothetical protein